MSNKIWIIGYNGTYRYKFDETVRNVFKPEEIEKYIKTPTFYKCYFKNGDYLYGSNFDEEDTRGRRFDAVFIDKYVYWNLLTDKDREQLSFVVPNDNCIFLV